MKNKFLKGLVASFALAVSGFANAGLITATTGDILWYSGGNNSEGFANLNQGFTIDSSIIFSRLLKGLDSNIIGNAVFSITAMGELDNSPEHIDIFTLDGINLGPLFNRVSADDRFNNTSTNDSYAPYRTPVTLSASLTSAELLPLLLDNTLDIRFSFSSDVNNYWSNTSFVRFDLEYEAREVPEPLTLAIYALALMGVASRKFKKQV